MIEKIISATIIYLAAVTASFTVIFIKLYKTKKGAEEDEKAAAAASLIGLTFAIIWPFIAALGLYTKLKNWMKRR